jgi:hypothetical protein
MLCLFKPNAHVCTLKTAKVLTLPLPEARLCLNIKSPFSVLYHYTSPYLVHWDKWPDLEFDLLSRILTTVFPCAMHISLDLTCMSLTASTNKHPHCPHQSWFSFPASKQSAFFLLPLLLCHFIVHGLYRFVIVKHKSYCISPLLICPCVFT